MTDPKPATPATDQEIAAWQHDCYTRSACDHGQFGPCLEQDLFARIAADAERLRAAEQHHRDMLTAVGEEATRQLAAKDEEIERWKENGNDERCIQNQFTELATLREQVGTLRAALKKLEWSGPNYSEGGISLRLRGGEGDAEVAIFPMPAQFVVRVAGSVFVTTTGRTAGSVIYEIYSTEGYVYVQVVAMADLGVVYVVRY